MAYIPQFVKLSGMSNTVNAIATDLGINASMVSETDLDSLKQIGKYVTGSTAMSNAFCDNLINRVAKVIYSGRIYNNSLALFKKGVLEYGEFIEDVFVALAQGKKRQEDKNELYQTNADPAVIPDVKTAFYMSNVRCNYTVSIRRADLDKAFTTLYGVSDLIERIVNSLVKSQSYDEYLLTKVKLVQMCKASINIGDGNTPTDGTATDISEKAREIALLAPFMSNHNIAGVDNTLDGDELCFIVKASVAAKLDVQVLANAFNMDKADFLGRRVVVDNLKFSEAEQKRLFAITGATTLDELGVTADGLDVANRAQCIICSKNVLQIYDTKAPYFTEDYNGIDDIRSYHLHVDQAYGVSPFENYHIVVTTD